MSPARILPALAAAATLAGSAADALAQKPSEDPRENNPFVLAYRCGNGDAVAVRYPAFKDAQREPIQLSWDGKRYTFYLTRSGSGARYVTRDRRLEWWTKGDTAFLGVPGVSPPILSGCATF
jgi:membrane-bound inhibitor of C-type lysozyme